MQTLEELKKHFINELVHQDLRRVFYILRQNVDNQCNKYDDLNLLHARYISASHDQNVKGILSSEEARLIFNQINATLLGFINDLTDKDLNLKSSAGPVSIPTPIKDIAQKATCNKGKILYKVPGLMELKKERKCIVRIAFDEKELEINDRDHKGSKVEPIRIAEVMEVQFIDQCKDDAFNIRTLSSSEQLVDRGDFTEWIFYVEPLLQGVYDLLLKVSVIEKRLGREIRKDIVMEKKIEVVATPVDVNDNLGIHDHKETYLAGAGVFAIPSGFEILDIPLLWEPRMIPPLSPIPTPLPLPPTYPPPNIFGSYIGLTIATIGLLWLVYIFWGKEPLPPPPSELIINHSLDSVENVLTLSIDGNYPSFKLGIKKFDFKNVEDIRFHFDSIKLDEPGSEHFSYFSLGLQESDSAYYVATVKDRNGILDKDSFAIKWKIPGPSYFDPLGIKVAPSSNQKALDLQVINGKYPFQINIINEKDISQDWSFHLIKARDTSLLFRSLKAFPKQGNFRVEVLDKRPKKASTNFSLKLPDILTIKATINKKDKSITMDVKGNRPPFILFMNNERIARLEKEGTHRKDQDSIILTSKGEQIIKVQDKNGNLKSTKVVFQNCQPKQSMTITGCFDPNEYKNTCSIFHLYKDKPGNYNQLKQVFQEHEVCEKIRNENFKIYHLDINSLPPSCGNDLFIGLKDENILISKGDNSKPSILKGYEDASKALSALVCRINPNSPGKKALKLRLTSGKTYRYKTNKGDNLSISPQSENKERVQVAAFLEYEKFDTLLQKLERIENDIFIRIENNFYKIYLGEFEDRKGSEGSEGLLARLREKFKNNPEILSDVEINEMILVKR